jgi:lipoprotein-anchoring transpeptidase ErfK/SrfK
LIKQRLFNFLKKQTSRVLQERTDLIIISVFFVMIMFCVINNAVSQRDEPEAGRDKLEVTGIYERNLAAISKGSAEAEISKTASPGLIGVLVAEEIQEENSEMGDAFIEPIEEDIMAEDVSFDYNEDHPIDEREQIIDFSNSDDFEIRVDLKKQRVFVLYKGEIIREMKCSTGADSSPTPPGEFTTTEKIPYSWVERFNMGAYYWVRFYKKYLFHSVPYDKDRNMITEELEKLGSPASHGCVRLGLEDAEWLYEKLPLGVKVRIY